MKDMLKKRNIMLKYEWYVKKRNIMLKCERYVWKEKYNAKIWKIC